MCPRRPWDHPRVCGEQLRRLMPPSAYQEPSPRVRGAGRGPMDQARFAGIIPRVCGEQFHLTDTGKALMGSSPRVRGAGHQAREPHHLRGIIPARAGSRRTPWSRRSWSWDHPRACGEQSIEDQVRVCAQGSSPRVRGAVRGNLAYEHSAGIIPARAGSRAPPGARRGWPGDHPRACGEQPLLHALRELAQGSSPRVRGAGPDVQGRNLADGIIPARAGSRRPIRDKAQARRDHPRACGEQF